MASSHITVGLSEDGRVSSKTTRIHPPGGMTHFSHDFVPESAVANRATSRVSRPPGGNSTIFSDCESTASSDITSRTNSVSSSSTENSPPPPQRQARPYRMKSSFELGDEQPARAEPMVGDANRRRSKPSVNPLTGELVGHFPQASAPASIVSEAPKPAAPAPEPAATPVKAASRRVPPGGHSTPLW